MKKKMISPINYDNLLGRVAGILLGARDKVVREKIPDTVWKICNSADAVCQI